MKEELKTDTVNAIAALAKSADTTLLSVTPPTGYTGVPVSVPVLLDRTEGRAASLKSLVDEWREKPARKTGTARTTTLESFIDLSKRHRTEASVLFADTDWKNPSLTTVVDYHPAEGEADNGKHRVHYQFPLSEEWQAWVGLNGKAMDQATFAEFIEDRIGEIAAPHEDEETYWPQKLGGKVAYPNEMITLSRGLKVFAETRVVNAVTIQSGEGQVSFEEEHRDEKGNKLIVPSIFIIQLPPFFRGEPIRVPVRLRYRVKPGEGKVIWLYQLYRPDTFITEEVMRAMEKASDDINVPAYQGTPEMSA